MTGDSNPPVAPRLLNCGNSCRCSVNRHVRSTRACGSHAPALPNDQLCAVQTGQPEDGDAAHNEPDGHRKPGIPTTESDIGRRRSSRFCAATFSLTTMRRRAPALSSGVAPVRIACCRWGRWCRGAVRPWQGVLPVWRGGSRRCRQDRDRAAPRRARGRRGQWRADRGGRRRGASGRGPVGGRCR